MVWFGCGLWWFPPACLDLLGVFGKPMLMMILMMTIIMIIIINHLSVSLVGRQVSSAHMPADDYGFIDRGATIFVTCVALGHCNGSTVTGIGPVRKHGPRDCCLVCQSPLSEVSTVTWAAILVTVDGFGFGTLTGESCLKNVHGHTDRASWDAILVTVVAFGALMWEKCAQSHSFGLGRVGGGGEGDTIGGKRVGEPRTRDHI